MSIGVQLFDGSFSIIIPKNTKLPGTNTEEYFTLYDNQTKVIIKAYQGEQRVAKANNFLGEFILDGIPPATAGKEIIDVTMEANKEGVLHVKAVCRSTGGSEMITITEIKNRLTEDRLMEIRAKIAKVGVKVSTLTFIKRNIIIYLSQNRYILFFNFLGRTNQINRAKFIVCGNNLEKSTSSLCCKFCVCLQ